MAFKIIGNSKEIKEIKDLIAKVAKTNADVLICGSSGTGKELVARQIHDLSAQTNKPFIAVNCAAIPADLLESELFGHEKGAFTGATNMRKGKFELAQGGTIFLDEIGDMPLAMQIKLLRILQEKQFERVGGHNTVVTNLRVISATNSNLQEKVQAGKFREDLFYRLNVFPIILPDLSKRKGDITKLVDFFLKKHNSELKVNCKLSQEALKLLNLYNWPGNIRELANFIHRMCILFPTSTVGISELPEEFKQEARCKAFTSVIIKNNKSEKEMLQTVLKEHSGAISKAADSLGMDEAVLAKKIQKYGLNKASKEDGYADKKNHNT